MKSEQVNIIMTKKRSPHVITFETDKSDTHFINVSIKKRKSRAVVATHYILRTDFEQWRTMYEVDGFKQTTEL